MDKRVQLKQHERNSALALINESSHLPIVPMPNGIVCSKGENSVIDMSNRSMGKHQATAFGKAMKYSGAERILLRNNRLSCQGAK